MSFTSKNMKKLPEGGFGHSRRPGRNRTRAEDLDPLIDLFDNQVHLNSLDWYPHKEQDNYIATNKRWS